MDVDLDAYAEDAEAPAAGAQPPEHPPERATERKNATALEAAELARVPLAELLPKLSRD